MRDDDREAVAFALRYPHRLGHLPPADPERVAAARADVAAGRRVALLGYGANAAPGVLAAKLGGDVAAGVVVEPVSVRGFDVAYSAHVSPHGAVPGTLVPSPGTVVPAAVLLLPLDAAAALDATEPNYERAPLPGVDAEAYLSRHGPLRLDGAIVALAAVAAQGRSLQALAEPELLARVRDELEPGTELSAFVLASIRSASVRERRSRRLREMSAG